MGGLQLVKKKKRKKSWGWGGLGDVTWRSKGEKINRGETLWSLFKVCGAVFVGKLKIFLKEFRLMDIQQLSSRPVFPTLLSP